ncbi:hypothetical protein FE374_13300 [Georgenia yuyongxinii]|uniref:Uncharacterized protein n=1 Tax=Georgenia yuyongxinii TaxID=2589797 RepID=A0A5B8CBC3_9MICO|nr:hypothetical protein FE374_13300 [Georgenia yuyongxinii]
MTLSVGRTEDVVAWVGTAAHTRITGLESWDALAVEDVEQAAGSEEPTDATEEPTDTATDAPAEDAGVPNPAGSDLWVAEQTGTGTAEMSWTDRDGRWSVLAATDGTAPAPQLSLTWPVEVRTPWLVPGLIVGAVLLLAGAALLVLDMLTARELRRREESAADRDDGGAATTVLPAAGAGGLTRRELRERQRAETASGRRRGGAATGEIPTLAQEPVSPERAAAGAARGAGIVPGSTRAEELRRGRETPAERTETMAAQHPEATEATEATVAMAAVNDGGTPEAAGVARGAGIVPASDRAAEFRRARGEDEHGPAAAGLRSSADMPAEDWTAGETGDLGAAAVPGGAAAVPGETTGADETEDGASAPPSWRSLWGFGERKDDEGEEKR